MGHYLAAARLGPRRRAARPPRDPLRPVGRARRPRPRVARAVPGRGRRAPTPASVTSARCSPRSAGDRARRDALARRRRARAGWEGPMPDGTASYELAAPRARPRCSASTTSAARSAPPTRRWRRCPRGVAARRGDRGADRLAPVPARARPEARAHGAPRGGEEVHLPAAASGRLAAAGRLSAARGAGARGAASAATSPSARLLVAAPRSPRATHGPLRARRRTRCR